MEGLRRFDEWTRIRTRIGSHREVPAIIAPIDLTTLSERERIVLRTVDGTRSISEIALLTHNSEFFVSSYVFHLLDEGKAELIGTRPAGPDSVEIPSGSPEDETVFEEAQEAPYGSDGVLDSEFSLPLPPPAAAARTIPSPGHSPASRPAPVEMAAAPPAADPQGDSTATGRVRPGDFARFLRRADSTSSTERGKREPGESSSFKGLIDPSSSLRPETASAPPAPAAPVAEALRIRQAAVPVLNRPMEELMSHSFTPNEAFILSRINGLWDVRSISKISPFPETEVLRTFQKLEDGGVISWR
jgi:hypothetical protein